MSNIYTASNQYAVRPDEERYFSVDEALEVAKNYKLNSRLHDMRLGDRHSGLMTVSNGLSFEADEDNLFMVGKTYDSGEQKFLLSNYATEYLCDNYTATKGNGKLTPSILGLLPAPKAVELLRAGIKEGGTESVKHLTVLEQAGVARAVRSSQYRWLFDSDLLENCKTLVDEYGYKVPPARAKNHGVASNRYATESYVLECAHKGLGVRVGDEIEGTVYLSDRDVFVTLLRDGKTVDIAGQKYTPCIIVQCGLEKPLRIDLALVNSVCGNLILWGVVYHCSVSITHRENGISHVSFKGDALSRLQQVGFDKCNPANLLEQLDRITLGKDRKEVITVAYGFAKSKQLSCLTKNVLGNAYDKALVYGADWNPNNAHGLLQGMTLVSQDNAYQGSRVLVDNQAMQWAGLVAADNGYEGLPERKRGKKITDFEDIIAECVSID